MGFRNPITTLSADQISPGTLAPGVIGRAIATADTGRRVVISTPAGDAGRIDFFADPDNPGNGEGHARLRVTSYGGVTSRAFLHLEPDDGASVQVGSQELPAGGWATAVHLDADQITDGTRPITRTAGVATLAADSADITSETTIMTLTCRIRDGRVRLTFAGVIQGTTAGDIAAVRIRRNPGAVIVAQFPVRIPAAGGPGGEWRTLTTTGVWVPELDFGIDANTTIYATLARTNGTGTVSAKSTARLIIDDGAAR